MERVGKMATTTESNIVEMMTVMGKPFSVERYYMLAEIEQQALRPVFLNDCCSSAIEGDNQGEGGDVNTTSSVQTDPTVDSDTDDKLYRLPPFVVLYLLWNCDIDDKNNTLSAEEQAESFRKGPLKTALGNLQSLSKKNRARENDKSNALTNVYVLIDVLIWSSDDESLRKKRFERHLSVVEALAKIILSPLSSNDDGGGGFNFAGATVGLADHPRAAPGLESCLDAIQVGARDRRRRFGNGQKSFVGIVCHSPEDLIGYDEEGETDAVQGVMQSLTHAKRRTLVGEDSTNAIDGGTCDTAKTSAPFYQSPFMDYAQTAHRYWRVHKAGWPAEPTPEEEKAMCEKSGSNNTVWILAMLVALAAYYYKNEW